MLVAHHAVLLQQTSWDEQHNVTVEAAAALILAHSTAAACGLSTGRCHQWTDPRVLRDPIRPVQTQQLSQNL